MRIQTLSAAPAAFGPLQVDKLNTEAYAKLAGPELYARSLDRCVACDPECPVQQGLMVANALSKYLDKNCNAQAHTKLKPQAQVGVRHRPSFYVLRRLHNRDVTPSQLAFQGFGIREDAVRHDASHQQSSSSLS